MLSTDYFKLLNEQFTSAEELSKQKSAKGFLGQEILRFTTIAGTLLGNMKPDGQFVLDDSASVDERYITHPLIRSLLENFFKIIYIFDDSESESERFEKAVNGFKEDYRKLFNDLNQDAWKDFMDKYHDSLQAPNSAWTRLSRLKNINDMLNELRNNDGNKLQYLYPLYRITSFDTHGNSLNVFFEETFDVSCNFPIIDIKFALNLMASEYFELLEKHK
ncbi:DUF5677 domain-containing protein [Acinetobacter sp. TUM15064]|uniref:DUF5677 domain-containing protein n=1 Tax=Acinetobacter sp. TUM15064 TaxID=2609134 RepID=UPI00124D5668|nr:DUF5677 domain-containing protein [Acinetobacter sp. TUM15064]